MKYCHLRFSKQKHGINEILPAQICLDVPGKRNVETYLIYIYIYFSLSTIYIYFSHIHTHIYSFFSYFIIIIFFWGKTA